MNYSIWCVLAVIVGLMGWTWERHSELQQSVEELKTARSWEKTFVNGIGQRMIWVPAGSFRMGDLTGNGDADEKMVRTVDLTGYHLAATEVTRSQWMALDDPSSENVDSKGLPIESVNWENAMEFCQKLTEMERKEGMLPEGYSYTLPSEAQWENACRAGSEGSYAGNLNEMAWYSDNSEGKVHPVATKMPNRWGFYDMHGNVWEWCKEWYTQTYDEKELRDPRGSVDGSDCVARGGGWGSRESHCRSSNRSRSRPADKNQFMGFRACLSPVVQKTLE